jgi:hypothetical protein
MAVYDTDCYMPIEMLDLIAAVDVKAYRAMLAIPLFARSLGSDKVVDYMIEFGYSVNITENHIEWFLNDELHRVDGPAIEFANGNKEWWRFGKLHRQARHGEPDGPAIERASGDKGWWLDGGRHRVDGPAIEFVNGDKEWWLNGVTHRDDGPAVEYANGYKEWYLNGIRQPGQ